MNIPKIDILYVLIQLFLFAVFFMDVKNLQFAVPKYIESLSIALLIMSIILMLAAFFQLNTKLSPFPSPVKKSTLITNGVFAFSRHPIYTAIIGATFSLGFYYGSGFKLLLTFVFILFFYFKSCYEEQKLEERFPEYKSYKKKTGRFLTLFSLKKN